MDGDRDPADPWREGLPLAAWLDETAMLAGQLEGMRDADELIAAVWALDEAELRAVVFERALRTLNERAKRQGAGTE